MRGGGCVVEVKEVSKHWALSIDEFCEEVFDCLERGQDGGAGHYARFTAGTREEAVGRVLSCLETLVDRMLYVSDDYGYPAERGGD